MRVQTVIFRVPISLFEGCIVLQVSQGLAIDFLSLLQVKRMTLNNDVAVFVARRLAWHQIRLLSPATWHGWGQLFIDAYFAAARNASPAEAQAMMHLWKQVHKELIVFYNETQEPEEPVPVPIADHMERHGYFPHSGMHWILD